MKKTTLIAITASLSLSFLSGAQARCWECYVPNCLGPKTSINLQDGTSVSIEDLNAGEKIASPEGYIPRGLQVGS